MPTVHHRYLTVDGHRLFFREAGDPNAPALVLLHGFPTSSYMFRNLVPALADRYHVIAPDHLGFGLSDAPAVEQFDYTFDALTALTQGLLRELKVDRYAIYVWGSERHGGDTKTDTSKKGHKGGKKGHKGGKKSKKNSGGSTTPPPK